MSIDRAASEAAERCLYCPKMCHAACPVAHESARETLTPWGIMSLVSLSVVESAPPIGLPGRLETLAQKARALLDGHPTRPLDADVAETFYACTGCRRCRTWCDHANDVPAALFQARAVAVDHDLAPAGARAVADRFARQGHPQEADVGEALARLALDAPSPVGGTSVLFAGCEAPVNSPKTVTAALRAARRLMAPLALAKAPSCCGRVLYEGGFRDRFRDAVEKAWEQLGDREVVVLSAACGRALSEWAREVGVEPRGPVVHVTTYLARRLGPDVQAPPLPLKVTYHDPCHLGRGLGEYEAPRRLLDVALASGLQEAPSSREDSDCCGATGLLPQTYPEVARAMAMSRADELRAQGAAKVATACPSCRSSLAAAGLDVVDVVEIVADWLDGAVR